MNDYLIALFDSKGKQVAVFDEIAKNDFMSTLSLT